MALLLPQVRTILKYALFYHGTGHLQKILNIASVDELAVLDGGKCILQLRGVRPFLSDKYDITKHPNYKYLSDADPKNNFDIEKFLSTRLKTKPEDTFDTYEISDTADSDYSE